MDFPELDFDALFSASADDLDGIGGLISDFDGNAFELDDNLTALLQSDDIEEKNPMK
jgi:hypothetical protein